MNWNRSTYLILCTFFAMFSGCSHLKMEDGRDSAGEHNEKGQKESVVSSIERIATWDIPTGTRFMQSEIGGISGIAYDGASKVYHLLSDDRSEHGPARFFTAEIDIQRLIAGENPIQFLSVTPLIHEDGTTFPRGSVDPEGIAISPEGDLFISSEGNARRGIAPFVNRYSMGGTQLGELPIDEKYRPKDGSGIRNNLAYESLTITPDGTSLVTATENSLIQDGPKADVDSPSISRLIVYDIPTQRVRAEFAYRVESVKYPPLIPGQFRTNGLVELLAIDNAGTFLALERAYSVGRGNVIKLYEVTTAQAKNIENLERVVDEEGRPELNDKELVQKKEILDFSKDLGLIPDNLEAMCFGPAFEDGSRLMVVASDNNFSSMQKTQFVFLKVNLSSDTVY